MSEQDQDDRIDRADSGGEWKGPHGDPSVPPPTIDLPPAPVFSPEARKPPQYPRHVRRTTGGGTSKSIEAEREITMGEILQGAELVLNALMIVVSIADALDN